MTYIRYIIQLIQCWICCEKTQLTKHIRKSDAKDCYQHFEKNSTEKKKYFLNRDAKFVPCFAWDEFGVFRYDINRGQLKALCIIGCRDPPFINRFEKFD